MAQGTVALSSIQSAIARAIRLDSSAYTRIERAAVLISLGAITKVADLEYTVLSQTCGRTRYVVTPGGCTCEDAARHPGQRCKHQWSVRILLSAQKAEQKAAAEDLATKQAAVEARFSALSRVELDRLSAFKRQYTATSPAMGV